MAPLKMWEADLAPLSRTALGPTLCLSRNLFNRT